MEGGFFNTGIHLRLLNHHHTSQAYFLSNGAVEQDIGAAFVQQVGGDGGAEQNEGLLLGGVDAVYGNGVFVAVQCFRGGGTVCLEDKAVNLQLRFHAFTIVGMGGFYQSVPLPFRKEKDAVLRGFFLGNGGKIIPEFAANEGIPHLPAHVKETDAGNGQQQPRPHFYAILPQ